MTVLRRLLALLALFLAFCHPTSASLNEEERREQYQRRNYTWPLTETVPKTDGWNQLMKRRFEQVAAIRDSNKRYEGYLQLMQSAIVAPNFTETGWGLSKAPAELLETLQRAVREGLEGARLESPVEVIEGERAFFVDRPDLMRRVKNDLLPFVEAWSGIKLVPHNAYGFRCYRDRSRLFMHVDKPATHIISAILHVDRSEDAQSWPIVIEDYQGNTNEVLLEKGDILFYESAKAWHGRPKMFHGEWYTSVFVHYYPEGWTKVDHMLEGHYAVPPVWIDEPPPDAKETLVMVGTSIKEPECPDVWCDLQNSVKWGGGGVEGEVLTTNQQKFHLKLDHDEL